MIETILQKYDLNWENNKDQKIISGISKKLSVTKEKLPLITFTCSTINAEFMFDTKKYEQYVSLSPEGNNLTDNLEFYRNFFAEASREQIQLIILIGNTDPYYIYSAQLELLPGVKRQQYLSRFSKRWKLYEQNLRGWLIQQLPGISFQVINWYEFQKDIKKQIGLDFDDRYNRLLPYISSYFSEDLFEAEKQRLKLAFGPGKYFEKLAPPSEEILNNWIRRKFTEYALQGLWIKLLWSDAILVQNEKPALLRYEMYQPLIKETLNTSLPNIFPFGIADGYG